VLYEATWFENLFEAEFVSLFEEYKDPNFKATKTGARDDGTFEVECKFVHDTDTDEDAVAYFLSVASDHNFCVSKVDEEGTWKFVYENQIP
jgi:hypothetical protein